MTLNATARWTSAQNNVTNENESFSFCYGLFRMANMDARVPQFPSSLPREKLIAFCKRWKIRELSFFGSFVRKDFGPESDIDVLVKFATDHGWTLLDHVAAQEELSEILGRPVDLVSKNAIERSRNELRRKAILEEARVYYTDEEAA